MEATCRCQASRSLPMTLLTLGCVCNSVGLTQAARGPEPSARARTAFLPTFAAPRAGMPQLRRCGYVPQAGRGQETARGVLGMWAGQGYGGTFSLLQRARLHPLHPRGMRTRAKPGPLHMSSAEREIAAAAVDEMLLESSMADACNAPQSTGRSSRQQEGAAGPSFSDSVEDEGFRIQAPFEPTGDQPEAIEAILQRLQKDCRFSVLRGATGTGKTFTLAHIINRHKRPTLLLCHNKTLAAQLARELKSYFPHNAVELFVSYYNYYRPEAYLPGSDTYIAKTTSINDELDALRHRATRALCERGDVIVVSTVSCIYGLGLPAAYLESRVTLSIYLFI